ncbi:MAG TPA: ORF6N domain-containing protein [Puia sp.]|jgi:hypothetical protein
MQLAIIQQKIYDIRGQKVMLDFDLAELYEVPTKVLNQAMRRNINRFPEDFMFTSYHNVFSMVSVQASPVSLPGRNILL